MALRDTAEKTAGNFHYFSSSPFSLVFASFFSILPSSLNLSATSLSASVHPFPSSLHFLRPDLWPLHKSARHFNHHTLKPQRITKPDPPRLAMKAQGWDKCTSSFFHGPKVSWACALHVSQRSEDVGLVTCNGLGLRKKNTQTVAHKSLLKSVNLHIFLWCFLYNKEIQ